MVTVPLSAVSAPTALVKICGLRTASDAIACREAGAALVGLNFAPPGRRAIDAPAARTILRERGGLPVLVYRDPARDTVLVESEALNVDCVQLHGDESPAFCARLRAHGLRVIKALPFAGDPLALLAHARRYVGAVDALLLDAPRPGSGQPWSLAPLAHLDLPRPFLLAGGLTPATVAAAIAAVRPDGVDVASGVETAGQIDPALVAAFVREATAALHHTGARWPWPPGPLRDAPAPSARGAS